jgi:alkaline phosphatase D
VQLDRRAFLAHAARAGLGLALAPGFAGCGGRLWGFRTVGPFAHGVASGDPLEDRVILWTRVDSAGEGGAIPVRWQIARDPGFAAIVASGSAEASAARDYTVKVDAVGLAAGTAYWFRFEALGAASPVGRTRTQQGPGAARLRLAIASCANITQGFWNAYAAIAQRGDLDAVVHLGDYLYEYANGTYGDGLALGRVPEPDREATTLADYRARHAQYKRDPDLQALHAAHPMIATWDDHEFANDAYPGGAQNHDPRTEGDWTIRRAAAVRAYREWMPVREDGMPDPMEGARLWRAFRIGTLADLLMLDTRMAGRVRQVPADDRAGLLDGRRTLLGTEQESWLFERLAASQRDGVAWRILGQQVLFGQLITETGRIWNSDLWDGYPAERDRVLAHLERDCIGNVLVLTGDIHTSWALELARDPFRARTYDAATGRGALAVELVTPAISSAPPVRDFAESEARTAEYRRRLPHLRYLEFWHRGYAILDLDRSRARAEWWHMERVDRPDRGERLAAAYEVRAGVPRALPA